MVVKHVICTDQSQPKLEHVAGVFPWGCLGTSCSTLWQALPCPATSKNSFDYPRCQLHPARWSGIFLLWFQTDPAKMACSHLRDPPQSRVLTLSQLWMALSHKCDSVTFFKRSGREGSIFINWWNRDLAVTERFVLWCLGAHCYLQPWKSPVPGTRGAWCKTPCHGLASHHTFAATPKARNAEDAMCYPGALLTPCQSQAGRSCWGRCLPTSPSRSPAKQWLSSRGEEVGMKSSK